MYKIEYVITTPHYSIAIRKPIEIIVKVLLVLAEEFGLEISGGFYELKEEDDG